MKYRFLLTALLLAGLTLVWSGQSLPAQTSGPLHAHPENPRYFADSSGKAILLTGSHTWPNLVDKNSRKVCGLLMVDGVLYAWVRNLNLPDAPKGTGAGMMVSTDRGRTWEWVDWN